MIYWSMSGLVIELLSTKMIIRWMIYWSICRALHDKIKSWFLDMLQTRLSFKPSYLPSQMSILLLNQTRSLAANLYFSKREWGSKQYREFQDLIWQASWNYFDAWHWLICVNEGCPFLPPNKVGSHWLRWATCSLEWKDDSWSIICDPYPSLSLDWS